MWCYNSSTQTTGQQEMIFLQKTNGAAIAVNPALVYMVTPGQSWNQGQHEVHSSVISFMSGTDEYVIGTVGEIVKRLENAQ